MKYQNNFKETQKPPVSIPAGFTCKLKNKAGIPYDNQSL
jgi:hypothetical protein